MSKTFTNREVFGRVEEKRNELKTGATPPHNQGAWGVQESILTEHGVQGMKWNVRKTPEDKERQVKRLVKHANLLGHEITTWGSFPRSQHQQSRIYKKLAKVGIDMYKSKTFAGPRGTQVKLKYLPGAKKLR